MFSIRNYFAQREALETIIYLYDVVAVKDKYDLMRFDSSGFVSAGMFDETWRRFVVKMGTGTGKTKVLSLVLARSFFHLKTLWAVLLVLECPRSTLHSRLP